MSEIVIAGAGSVGVTNCIHAAAFWRCQRLVYDTMWDSTRRMAEAIEQGITEADKAVAVKLYNISRSDKNDVIAKIFKSKAILAGSPTMNRGILYAVGGLLEMIKGLAFENKKAAAFGSYRWSGEAVKILSAKLKESGFEMLDEGIRETWNPNTNSMENCISFGRTIAPKMM